MKHRFTNALSLAMIVAMLFTSVGLADQFNADADALALASPHANFVSATQNGGTTVVYDFSAYVKETGNSTDNVFPGTVAVAISRSGLWLDASSGLPASFSFTSYDSAQAGTVRITVACGTEGTAQTMKVRLNPGTSTSGDDLNVDYIDLTYVITAGPDDSSCAPANTPPSVSVTGVADGATYNKGSVPAAACSVTDAQDGPSTFAATLSAITGPYASDGIGSQTASCSYTDNGGLTASASATYSIVDASAPGISYVLDAADPDGSNGWYKSDVSLTWTVTENESPNSLLKTGCVDQDIAVDQLDTTYSCSASSAGGSAGPVTVSFKRDATAPTISGSASPAANGAGWNNTNVAVAFTCNDNLSSVASCGPNVTVSSEGAGQSVTGNAVDNAGNSASATVSNINIDKTKPTISAAVSAGTVGLNGWYVGDVTVHFTCSDSGSGIPVDACPADQVLSTEGAAVASTTMTVTDAAGNTSALSNVVTVKIDKTAPSATLAVTAGTIGANGWYTSDVTVSTSGSDSVSGPVTCTANQFQTDETSGNAFNGSCTNDAGLSTNAAPLTVKLDKTGPSASLAALGTLGSNGWFTSDVTIQTTGADSISNPTTCAAAQFQTTDTASATFNGSCTNDAGLSTNATALTIKRDATAPTAISFVGGPTAGGSYYFGSVPAAPICNADGALSGLASCVVTGYETTVGNKTMTATATDNAGNVGTANQSYTVLAWTVNGFYAPVDRGIHNLIKGGATVPLKFEVFAGPTELTATSIITTFVTLIACVAGPTDDIEQLATGATSLRYDTTGGQFIWNWQTPRSAGTCYRVTVKTADGTSISADFKTK
jgi:hypothetical protein